MPSNCCVRRFLKLAGNMLQGWTEVATTRIAIPRCPSCGKPMRHKGLKPCTLTTTLGDVRLRRPRYRCMHCKIDIYPHDQHIRFLSNGVSLALGKVLCRLGADRPFGRAAEDLHEDYGVRLCKQTIENVPSRPAGISIAARIAGARRSRTVHPSSDCRPCPFRSACRARLPWHAATA